ncbi:MAG: hypothetical protein GXY24_05960 [Bacteroidales bacterium]|jgi:1-acyl-sn-glycerol-3-phosphate acyltransferase|nr:hypothetical protein [Bacteroidales bacterium]
MAKIWEEYRGYRLCLFHVNNATRTCFRSIHAEGIENLPKDGAVLLAPNHCAALMDPMLILATLPPLIAFGARSDIFAKPRIARILRWLRIVPIARERNGLSEVAKNFETFDEVIDCLAHDVPFCLFSEGTHRAERGMMPVKKGIFRLAKMAMERLPGKKVYIVPVGLDYEYFFRGYGRAVVRVGEAIDINEQFAREDVSEAQLYRQLCEDLRERILGLIGRIKERCHKGLPVRIPLAVLSLPVFAVCAVGALPIWLPYLLIMRKMEDKAWSHTVRFALSLCLPLFWIFQIGFGRLLEFYRNIFEDLRR